MSKSSNMVYKTLIFAVIVLFVCVAVQPAFALTKDGDNNPPEAPKLSGPTRVPPGTYEYTFNATDPDGDNIKYHIEWGDGNGEETEFYSSGEKVTVNHTFSEIQVYYMKAQAIDPYDYSSEWATLRIEISKSRQISNLFTHRFLEQFPLLEVFLRIMNLLR